MYRLHFEPTKALVSSSQGELWHRRMAHLHHGALKHLRQAVIGVPQVQEESITTARAVHSDVCRPISVHSFSGYSYCVTFIDDYSRKT